MPFKHAGHFTKDLYGAVPSTLNVGSRSEKLYAYLATLGTWTFDLRFNELSGAAINRGTDGNTGTVANCTQAQAGQLGNNEAYLFNGTTSIITFANANVPATKALTTRRWMFLVNPSSLGEGNLGVLFHWGDATNNRLVFNAVGALQANVDTDTTDAAAATAAGVVSLSTWTLYFMDYDDANVMGLGRRIRIFMATAASAAALLPLGTDTAATGTVVTSVSDLTIGNRPLTDRTFAGLQDAALAGSGLWTPTATPTDLSRLNRIRSIVFSV